MIYRRSLLAVYYALAYAHVCISVVLNRTIDDVNGDTVTGFLPIYDPPAGWNIVFDNNCTICWVHPDSAQAFDHTWHDVTQQAGEDPYSVTLQFTGTSISFFGIVPNLVPGSNALINLTFALDGASVGNYTHIPDSSTTAMMYSVPMLSLAGLSNQTHTLVAKTWSPSLFIFDYANYTFNDGVTVPLPVHRSKHIIAPVVGSIGGVVVIGLLAVALVWFRRRRSRRHSFFLVDPDPPASYSLNPGPQTREVVPTSPADTPIALPPYTPYSLSQSLQGSSSTRYAPYSPSHSLQESSSTPLHKFIVNNGTSEGEGSHGK
ncbi:hypothetical protein B0H19DRAFT_1095447 [Mycena capillaripes]|nr:hypothetical protein B0H19DRAFT_1095447 [Mycena capillaripes]